MSAPVNWWHSEAELGRDLAPESIPAPSGRIEWMREAPRIEVPQMGPVAAPSPLAHAAAWLGLGVVVGCYLVAVAEWIGGAL